MTKKQKQRQKLRQKLRQIQTDNKDSKMECFFCSLMKDRKEFFKYDCEKEGCFNCVFNNIVNYDRLVCPYCKIDINFKNLIKQMSDKKIDLLKSYSDSSILYSPDDKEFNGDIIYRVFKDSINDYELINRMNKNIVLCDKFMTSLNEMLKDKKINLYRFNKFKGTTLIIYETFINILSDFKPFIISINKDGNILLTDEKYVIGILTNPNIEGILQWFSIKEIGFFENGYADKIFITYYIDFKRLGRIKIDHFLQAKINDDSNEFEEIKDKLDQKIIDWSEVLKTPYFAYILSKKFITSLDIRSYPIYN